MNDKNVVTVPVGLDDKGKAVFADIRFTVPATQALLLNLTNFLLSAKPALEDGACWEAQRRERKARRVRQAMCEYAYGWQAVPSAAVREAFGPTPIPAR